MNNLNKNLKPLRDKIDFLDKELIWVLAKRMKLAQAIGKCKAKCDLQPLDRKRWQEVLNSRILLGKNAGLSLAFVRSLFELIHKHSLLIQKGIKP